MVSSYVLTIQIEGALAHESKVLNAGVTLALLFCAKSIVPYAVKCRENSQIPIRFASLTPMLCSGTIEVWELKAKSHDDSVLFKHLDNTK